MSSFRIIACLAITVSAAPATSGPVDCTSGNCFQLDYNSLIQVKQSLAAGTEHSHWEWNGYHYSERLDDVNGTEAASTGVIVGATTPERMITGGMFTCAMSDDSIACWGGNMHGQLGRADTVGILSPSAPDEYITLGNSQCAAGLAHMCCVIKDGASGAGAATGKVKCWGRGNKGQLGYGASTDIHAPGSTGYVDLGVDLQGYDNRATAMACGNEHSCALLNNSQVKCWGNGANGRLGNGMNNTYGAGDNTMGDFVGMVSLGLQVNWPNIGLSYWVTKIAVGHDHSCVILNEGSVKCWGKNADGQLGYGQWHKRDTGGASDQMGVELPAISLGSMENGTAYTAKDIAAGGHHTCAVLNTGRLKCWGRNIEGQLGLENSDEWPDLGGAPNQMGDMLPLIKLGAKHGTAALNFTVKEVCCGRKHTCVIVEDSMVMGYQMPNRVKCWGANGAGQLGTQDQENKGQQTGTMGVDLGPISLGPGRQAIHISCGDDFTCVQLDNGDMKCFGRNNKGQLGSGNNNGAGGDADTMSDNLKKIQHVDVTMTTDAPSTTA